MLLGSIVNVAAIAAGSLLGFLFKKAMNEKLNDFLMKGLGLCILYIAIKGSLDGENSLVLIVSMVIGGIIGHALDLDAKLNDFGDKLQKKLTKDSKGSRLSEGFASATLLYCVGAMAIVGSLQSGLTGNHETLFTKSLLDGISSVVLTSQFGLGVALSVFPLFIYQGAITLCAGWLSPILSDLVISEMTCIGYVIIIAIALNMMKLTKFKVMNYVPAIFVSCILVVIIEKIPAVYNFLYA